MRPIRATASGAITGSWLPVDQYVAAGTAIGFFVTSSGAPTGTYSIEVRNGELPPLKQKLQVKASSKITITHVFK